MTPYPRSRRRGGLLGLALTIGGAAGCAPPCYDDGLFQGGCPTLATEGGTGTVGDTTGTSSDGTTVSGSAEGGVVTADGDSGSSSDTGPTLCPGIDEELSYDLLTFQLVVEQSNAMTDMFDGSPRWSAIEDALVDAPDGAVTQRQSVARFGITSYYGIQAGCPRLETVAPQLDAADEIAGHFAAEAPIGANPVGDTILEVTDDLTADAWDGPKSIVLVLANEPSTCDLPAPSTALDFAVTRGAAEEAVAAAYVAGFPTAVVTLGDDVDAGFLQVLANAGVGHQAGDPDATFYVTHDDAELETALADIFDPGRPCSFPLDTALPLELAPGCMVQVNGVVVDFDDPNGWNRPDEQTVELQGTACESIQQGDATVEMVCNCDDV